MVRRSKGIRSKTRNILRKSVRQKGMPPITRSFARFEEGERVNIVIEPSVHGGMPHTRFQGLCGIIVGKQGNAYLVDLKHGNKQKQLIVRPEHLKKQG